jgi:hypothetical protein
LTQINLVYTFDNCVARGATKEQLQDFINRLRRQFSGDPMMMETINELQSRIRKEHEHERSRSNMAAI